MALIRIFQESLMKQLYFNSFEYLMAFSKVTGNAIFIVDYCNKTFDYVSENSLYLCGCDPEKVKTLGFDFYIEYVPKKEVSFLLELDFVVYEFFKKIPVHERNKYFFSCDYHLRIKQDKLILVNQKLAPTVLTSDGKMLQALTSISLSSRKSSGNIIIQNSESDTYYEYNLEQRCWTRFSITKLTDKEKKILELSIKGYKIHEIAHNICLSEQTIKFHRSKIFEKLGVNNMMEAITFINIYKPLLL